MKKLWIGLFCVALIPMGLFVCRLTPLLVQYFLLNERKEVSISAWHLQEKGSLVGPDTVTISAEYAFSVKGNEFTGKMEIPGYFLNEPAARSAIAQLEQAPWEVFYCKAKPTINSLRRYFPFRELFRVILVAGILVYFVFLKKWIARTSV